MTDIDPLDFRIFVALVIDSDSIYEIQSLYKQHPGHANHFISNILDGGDRAKKFMARYLDAANQMDNV